VDASFKDDVTVLLLLGVSFAVAFHEAPAKRIEEAYRKGVFVFTRLAIDASLYCRVHRGNKLHCTTYTLCSNPLSHIFRQLI
jgi:hypothetical protein